MKKSGSTLNATRIIGLGLVLGVMSFGTTGCSSIGKALGLEKTAPDEFAVVTKAPLVIPPDFSLRPPKPGAQALNQQSPSDAAATAVFQTAGNEVAPDTQSAGEMELVAQAGAYDTDGSIRQIVEEDYAESIAPKKTMLSRLAFWRGGNKEAAPPSVAGSADKAAKEAKERYVEREKRKTFAERVFFWRHKDDEEKTDTKAEDDGDIVVKDDEESAVPEDLDSEFSQSDGADADNDDEY